MNPRAQEVVPRAIARERLPATPPAGPVDAMARRINEQSDEANWRKGMELGQKQPIDARKIAEKAEQIGVRRRPDGTKNRTTEEETRYTAFKSGAEIVRNYLDGGLNAITDPTVKGALRGAVLRKAGLRPALAAEMAGMSVAERNAFADRLLTEPQYAGKVREILSGFLSTEMIDETSINNAQDEVKEQEYKRNDKRAEIDDVDRRLDAKNRQLKEFERPAAGAMGTKAAEIDTLKTNSPTLQAELATFRRAADDAEFRLGQLQQERTASLRPGATGRSTADIDTEIATERTNLRNAQTEVGTREASIARLPQLEQEEKQLEEEKRTLEKEKRERTVELNEIRLELSKRERAFADLQSVRNGQEEALVNGVGNVFNEAASQTLDEQVQDLSQKFDAEVERLKAESVDQNEQALYDALRERWLGPERVAHGILGLGRERRYRPINRDQVNRDRDVLLREGPPALMRQLLMSRINPATGAHYTAVEADQLINNKDFRDKMQPEMVKQVLARRMLVGRMYPEDIHIVVNSPWGQGMIEQGLARNEEFRSAVEKVMGAGSLEGHGFIGRIGREFARHPWLFALLLGIPVIIAAAGTGTHQVERT